MHWVTLGNAMLLPNDGAFSTQRLDSIFSVNDRLLLTMLLPNSAFSTHRFGCRHSPALLDKTIIIKAKCMSERKVCLP